MDEKLDYKEKKSKKQPINPIFMQIFEYGLILGVICFLLFFGLSFVFNMKISGKGPYVFLIQIVKLIPRGFLPILIILGFISMAFSIAIWFLKCRCVKYDKWVDEIAAKRISTENIWFTSKKVFFSYDVGLKRKDIEDFVREISDKSNYFTYYLQSVDIDQGVVSIAPVKKAPLPEKASLDTSKDTIWNFIPLADVIDDKRRKISTIGWFLNKDNNNEEIFQTEPSVSMLISGGTGSGKSVTLNCIIGHLSRHEDRFQTFLLDIKKVEFGPLKNLASVKKVGLEMDQIVDILKNAQALMMQRFRMMADNGANHIHKLEGIEVDFYNIFGKEYQFDEIFNVRVDGKEKLMTAEDIYKLYKNPPVEEVAEEDEGSSFDMFSKWG